MLANYITMAQDRLDKICRKVYGSERNGTVEAVLDANQGLAAHGPILPAGLVLVMPEITVAPPKQNIINLWD